MAKTRSKVEGLPQLLRALRDLPKKEAKRVARKAVTAATTPALKAMRKEAPVGETKNLRKAVMRRMRTYAGGLLAVLGTAFKRAPHDHLVEDGTGERVSKKTGKSTGKMPPDPFVARTYRTNKAQMQRILERELREGIESAAKELGRR